VSKKNLIGFITKVAKPIAEESGYELVDLEFVKENSNNYLRVYIDKPGGVNLDDCQNMSQLLSEKLDESDPITVPYYLEISSPGLDRPLKTDKDLKRNLNKDIEIRLYEALDGKKVIEGILESFDENLIVVLTESNIRTEIQRNVIALIKLAVKF